MPAIKMVKVNGTWQIERSWYDILADLIITIFPAFASIVFFSTIIYFTIHIILWSK